LPQTKARDVVESGRGFGVERVRHQCGQPNVGIWERMRLRVEGVRHCEQIVNRGCGQILDLI
jgi:hypothetical protein